MSDSEFEWVECTTCGRRWDGNAQCPCGEYSEEEEEVYHSPKKRKKKQT